MAAEKQILVTDEQFSELQARKGEFEPYHAVIQRLLDHSEATQAERSDADDIVEEITTALANGDVPVVLADGEPARIASEVARDE